MALGGSFPTAVFSLSSVTISGAAWLLCSTAVSFDVTISDVAWLLSVTVFSFVGCVAAVPIPFLYGGGFAPWPTGLMFVARLHRVG
ncbi:hypothetical protein MtrunA17_Chr8g0344881 [Medicago truncatula]|uniref:Transmembrane protein, putative n=1 Tax=Medicago truncatula TaxID=3880 RepID=G7L929_MEDTR|nr:transmembrane protein, putative [Medicago truncatula]RHN39537.1 hypothetical protein MtrunA17_Chr8g0344881 [Medicago truncatula]